MYPDPHYDDDDDCDCPDHVAMREAREDQASLGECLLSDLLAWLAP
jgi:hypothetical protein